MLVLIRIKRSEGNHKKENTMLNGMYINSPPSTPKHVRVEIIYHVSLKARSVIKRRRKPSQSRTYIIRRERWIEKNTNKDHNHARLQMQQGNAATIAGTPSFVVRSHPQQPFFPSESYRDSLWAHRSTHLCSHFCSSAPQHSDMSRIPALV